MFILKTKPEHRELMKQTMDLPDGAMDILCGNPDKGEGILRVEGESVLIRSNPTDADWKFVESNRAVGQEKKDAQGVTSSHLFNKFSHHWVINVLNNFV